MILLFFSCIGGKVQRLEQDVLALKKENAALEQRISVLEENNAKYNTIMEVIDLAMKNSPYLSSLDNEKEEGEQENRRLARRKRI